MDEKDYNIANNVVMKAKDSLQANLGKCTITNGTKRYNFMQAINLEANFEKTKEEIPVLGKTGKGNKSTGWKGTGSATFHYNTSIFREMMADYKNTGKDVYFDITIENGDPTSDAGYQIVTLKDCNIDGGILAKFDADGGYLDEDMDFTFEDFEITHSFTALTGFLINNNSNNNNNNNRNN